MSDSTQNQSAGQPQSKQSKSPSHGPAAAITGPGYPRGGRPKVIVDARTLYEDPVGYDHPFPSMLQLAELLALRHNANRTRHAYYRDMRLVHEHFDCDPALLLECQIHDYLLHVKLQKQWKPKTSRQTVASAKIFYLEMLGQEHWKVFSQVRAKDHDELPAVLTRDQVQRLLCHVRLGRYRTPLKLIYCCGLRLSECLSLTIHDVLGSENKLCIRRGKGNKDRVIPLADTMLADLRAYWSFHRNPLLLFSQRRPRLADRVEQARLHPKRRQASALHMASRHL